MNNSVPLFNKEFVFIVNINSPVLSALAIAAIHKPNHYTPIFIFPKIDLNEFATLDPQIEDYKIASSLLNEFAIKTHNAIRQLRSVENVVLCGLSDSHENHLGFIHSYNTIRIDSESDVELFLESYTTKTNTLLCREEDIYFGLFEALKSNSYLRIDNDAEAIISEPQKNSGLIHIENLESAKTILAICYASSVNSDIHLTKPLDISQNEIEYLIESWKSGNDSAFTDLSSYLYKNIEDIEFKDYSFSTFFTTGAPYSLIIKNILPCTYVDLYTNPDFFVFNGIYSEFRPSINSTIVFSPLEFNNEETEFVIRTLDHKNLFVTPLIDNEATAFNLSMYIQEFPYELLHICSHGGEIGGHSVSIEFIDSENETHHFDYDTSLSLAPSSYEDLVEVQIKYFPRKLNGMLWKSKELKEKKYSHEFYDLLKKAMTNNKTKGIEKSTIRGTSSIKCKDFNYQGMFNNIAGSNCSPFIFNNTCWSWSGIADSFIRSGSPAYIGTLWNIDNPIAVKTAETFYENLFGSTISSCLHNSLSHSIGTKDEGIYIFWGLHFSTLKVGDATSNHRFEVASRLMKTKKIWEEHLISVTDPDTIKNINQRIRWLSHVLKYSFSIEVILMKLWGIFSS